MPRTPTSTRLLAVTAAADDDAGNDKEDTKDHQQKDGS